MAITNKIRPDPAKTASPRHKKNSKTPNRTIIPLSMLLRQGSSADWPGTIYNGHPCWSSQGFLDSRILFDTGPHNSRISATGPHKFLQVLVFGKEHTGPQNNLQGARHSEQPVM